MSPAINPFTKEEIQKRGYNDEVFGFFNYKTDVYNMVSDKKNYKGNYLGEGNNPQWVKSQAVMGKVMSIVNSNTGETFLDNVIHNCFFLRENLIGVPIKIIATKKMSPDTDIDNEKEIYKSDSYSNLYSLDQIYGHDLNEEERHSGSSQAVCVCNVITLAMNIIGVNV